MEQVREAVGVTLCVLCSNVQLHSIYSSLDLNLRESSGVGDEIFGDSRSRLLSDEATERAIRIQKTTHSDHIDAEADVIPENGITKDSEEDVKWMETVMHFSLDKSNHIGFICCCNSLSHALYWGLRKLKITASRLERRGLLVLILPYMTY